jgi:hypothetical protein
MQHPVILLWSTAGVILIALGFLDPIVQDVSYHNFADERTMYTVSNFWNVVSNVPFFFVGMYALFSLKKMLYKKQMYQAFVLFFIGVSLVAFGSGYYHLDPNNETLIWDRIPMTIAFMALFAIIISEFISLQEGKKFLYPLLGLGVFSVAYWALSDDLRLYTFVQFYPMLAIPIILLFFKASYTLGRGYGYLLLCYGLAKVFEYYDYAIYEILGFISRHSLKHMVVALGLYVLVRVFMIREEHRRDSNRPISTF